MNPDEHHVALPKLYGAPAYARPPRTFESTDRPEDPDDLPLEAFRADDGAPPAGGGGSRADTEPAADPTDADGGDATTGGGPGNSVAPRLTPRPFSITALRRFLQGH